MNKIIGLLSGATLTFLSFQAFAYVQCGTITIYNNTGAPMTIQDTPGVHTKSAVGSPNKNGKSIIYISGNAHATSTISGTIQFTTATESATFPWTAHLSLIHCNDWSFQQTVGVNWTYTAKYANTNSTNSSITLTPTNFNHLKKKQLTH